MIAAESFQERLAMILVVNSVIQSIKKEFTRIPYWELGPVNKG